MPPMAPPNSPRAGFLVSVSKKSVQQIHPPSLESIGVSSDGSQMIVTTGCGGPLSVHHGPIDEGEPVLSHKVLDCAKETITFHGNLYAICTYKLSGQSCQSSSSQERMGDGALYAFVIFDRVLLPPVEKIGLKTVYDAKEPRAGKKPLTQPKSDDQAKKEEVKKEEAPAPSLPRFVLPETMGSLFCVLTPSKTSSMSSTRHARTWRSARRTSKRFIQPNSGSVAQR